MIFEQKCEGAEGQAMHALGEDCFRQKEQQV